ncbi:hypothetical protein, partial [Staphylococcus aureus]
STTLTPAQMLPSPSAFFNFSPLLNPFFFPSGEYSVSTRHVYKQQTHIACTPITTHTAQRCDNQFYLVLN